MHKIETTVGELVEIADELGLLKELGSRVEAVALVEDMNWAYAQRENELRQEYPDGDQRIITISPIAQWKWGGDPGPLREVIARGHQTPEETEMLLRLFDDTVSGRGGLAMRRPTSAKGMERRERAIERSDAALDVWDLQPILERRMGKYGSRKRAMQVVSLFYRIPYCKIEAQVALGPRHPQNQI